MAKRIETVQNYAAWLADLKSRIHSARVSAARAISRDLISLYWDIGCAIVEKQQAERWGESVIERIARDLAKAFPGVRGFSPRNLRDMKRFYQAYRDPAIWRQAVAKLEADNTAAENWRQAVAKLEVGGTTSAKWRQPVAKSKRAPAKWMRQLVSEVPWGHNLLILNKVESPDARLFYLQSTIRFGWTRDVLLNQIKVGAYKRSQKTGKSHNFPNVMPERLAGQAVEALKSSYNLEFLGIGREIHEQELEKRLVEQLREFILQLSSSLPRELKGKLPNSKDLSKALGLPEKRGRRTGR